MTPPHEGYSVIARVNRSMVIFLSTSTIELFIVTSGVRRWTAEFSMLATISWAMEILAM